MVRHAEGTHNLEENYGDRDNIDARLTPKGLEQCAQLAQQVQANRPELVNNVDDIRVISSPLTRCVQTALHSFPWLAGNDSISFTAYESIRETVNYACDRRRPISVIAQEFPRVDFASFCQQDNDFIWDSYRNRLSDDWEKHMESAELNAVASRGYDGFLFLQQQEQHHLVICSHSAFLRCILNWGQEGGVPQRMTQILDERSDKTNHKLFDYDDDQEFEQYMRSNYENCELRSFCLLVNKS
jgi:broad specificity phosphatase PhoE